mmetsp:Transcript_7010/g.15178  ORF Transcript_7010/g.15178 Transcript_7010/m.15178 type:complete len:332 (-) Transcript_7010:977-1972(-)
MAVSAMSNRHPPTSRRRAVPFDAAFSLLLLLFLGRATTSLSQELSEEQKKLYYNADGTQKVNRTNFWIAAHNWTHNNPYAVKHWGPIETWNVSGVTNFNWAFFNNTKTNLRGIAKWNTRNATYLADMFSMATGFNVNLGSWNVTKVKTMASLFSTCIHFDRDLDLWDVSRVRNMKWMFMHARKFNGDISPWDVSSVEYLQGMFFNATSFRGDLSRWNTRNATQMEQVFEKSVFNGDISQWNVTASKEMTRMFARSLFNGDLGQWDVSNVEKMARMFWRNRQFVGENIGQWDVSKGKHTKNISKPSLSFFSTYFYRFLFQNNNYSYGHAWNF